MDNNLTNLKDTNMTDLASNMDNEQGNMDNTDNNAIFSDFMDVPDRSRSLPPDEVGKVWIFG